MNDHDDIVRLLHRAVDTAPAGDEQIDAIGASARRRRTMRGVATATGATAVLAIALIAAAVVSQQPGPKRLELADEPPAPREVPADAEAAWSELPEAPLDTRWGAFSYADDDELLVWGGYAWGGDGAAEGPRADGALYWNDRWSLLPDGPLSPRMRTNGVGGWVDDEFWIVGGTGGPDGTTPLQDAAAYRPGRPRQGQWRELPSLPEPIVGGGVAGSASMVAVAQDSGGSRAVYALRPGERQWAAVDPLPPPSAPDNSDLHLIDVEGHVIAIGQGDMFMIANGLDHLEWERVSAPDGGRTFGNIRGVAWSWTTNASDESEGFLVVVFSDGTYRFNIETRTWSRVADGLRPDPPQPIPLVVTYDETLVAVDVVSGQVHALTDGGWTALSSLGHARVDAAVETTWHSEGRDDDKVVSDIVVWGGMGSEEPGSAQGMRLRLRQEEDW